MARMKRVRARRLRMMGSAMVRALEVWWVVVDAAAVVVDAEEALDNVEEADDGVAEDVADG